MTVKTKATLAIILGMLIGLICGCNYYQSADTAYHVIDTAIGVAQAELPAYLQAGITSPAENATLSGVYVSLHSLNTAFGACNEQVKAAKNNKAGYAACANTFAGSLLNPATLAGLRVISPAAQGKAQVLIIAIVGGINVVMDALGQANVTAPSITTVQKSEIMQFEGEVAAKACKESNAFDCSKAILAAQ